MSLIRHISIASSLLVLFEISGHGFGEYTLVRLDDKSECIKQVCENLESIDQWVLSYNPDTNASDKCLLLSAGESETNCFFRIGIDRSCNNDIVCTPTQEFYMPKKKEWVPAYKLKLGDELLSESNTFKTVTHISFVKQSEKIYSLEVAHYHTYLVGRHRILTHNIALPVVTAGLSIAFGEGATIGGIAGGIFGPITLGVGLVVGGVIGLSIKAISGRQKKTSYFLDFNTNDIDKFLQENPNQVANGEKEETTREEKLRPQQPRRPSAENGFSEPKNFDGEKKRHPKTGQYGWPDDKGNLWVPANSHAGFHWDKVDRHGNHENVYPGGHIRKGTK